MLAKNLPAVPAIYKDAIAGPDAAHWLQAISAEIQSAMAVEAWDFTEKLKRQRIIDSKWVYSIKTDINGNFIKKKAR